MTRKIIGSVWDRENRNAINDNFEELYGYKNTADSAKEAADYAVNTAEYAKAKAESVQAQFNQVVIEGDSSVEAAQARVDAEGNSYPTLKARLDAKETELSSQLAKTESKLNMENWELNSKGRQKRGFTVFISDDGRIEEYTVALPIFESEGVPQSIAVVSDWVGNENFCGRDELLELQNIHNWEIMSHSKSHPQPFPSTPDSQVESEFRDSRQELMDMGLKVYNYAYPGGNYGKRERLLAKKYYRAARCSDRGVLDGVNVSPLNTYELKTLWIDPKANPLRSLLEQYTREEAIQRMYDIAKETIDKANELNGIAIISTHFKNIDTQDLQNLYRDVIRYAKTVTRTTTLNEALNAMGNLIEIGDYSQEGLREEGSSHFVVGVEGEISGSLYTTNRDQYNALTNFDVFPHGVIYTPISHANSEGTPENSSGVLITYKMDIKEMMFNRQEFITYRGRKYERSLNDNGTYGSWKLVAGNSYGRNDLTTPNTPLSQFPEGVTISAVLADSVGIVNAPNQERGTLVTIKPYEGGSYAYSFQLYYLTDGLSVYRRHAINDSEWGKWEKQNVLHLPKENNYNPATPFSDFPEGTTYSLIKSDNPYISLAPNGKNGLLITHRVTLEESYGYNFQEYHVFNSPTGETYKRFATGLNTWGEWIKIYG